MTAVWVAAGCVACGVGWLAWALCRAAADADPPARRLEPVPGRWCGWHQAITDHTIDGCPDCPHPSVDGSAVAARRLLGLDRPDGAA